jgi:pSer/pThr/pTyr-binding forkhead associated (FHA) protein
MEDMRWLTEAQPLNSSDSTQDRTGAVDFIPLRLRIEPAGLHIEVQRPDVIVGRHTEADIRLALSDISRRHCRLVFENGHWRVHDLDSLNGTFVNGERLQEASLHEGDRLQLGAFSFIVEASTPNTAHSDDEAPIDILRSIAEAMKDQKRAS